MNLNKITLAFSGEQAQLEALFQRYHFDHSITQVRIFIIFGLLTFAAFSLRDLLFVPEKNLTFLFIRFGIVIPVVLFLLLLSFTSAFFRFWQLAIAIGITLAGLGITAIIGMTSPQTGYNFYVGLIIVLMFGYTLFQARFIWASITGLVIIAGYEICAIWICNLPAKILINNNFFLISFNLAGMMACYTIEYYNRRNFYLLHLLGLEKEKSAQINKELAEKIFALEQAMNNINLLKGFIPICANCKKIRDDRGYWNQVEAYIAMQEGAELSHSICPECANVLYKDFLQ